MQSSAVRTGADEFLGHFHECHMSLGIARRTVGRGTDSKNLPLSSTRSACESKGSAMHLRSMLTSSQFELAEVVAILTRTPASLDALLRGLPDTWVHGSEGRSKDGEDTWSAFAIVGHLIHGERTDWMPRAGIFWEKGKAGSFDLFAPRPHLKESQGKSLDHFWDEFARLRGESLAAL